MSKFLKVFKGPPPGSYPAGSASNLKKPSQIAARKPSRTGTSRTKTNIKDAKDRKDANDVKDTKNAKDARDAAKGKDIAKAKKEIEFQLPPLSIVGKKREINFEEIRKKIMRRNNPEGEDKKQLASILRYLNQSKAKITVQEYVNLVSKYTSDNGEAMRKVMEEDIASFRKMVTKVYETMTQDVSDVLVNEQIQTVNFYNERYDMYNHKTLWMISEIYSMIPEFDFERYARDGEQYLNYIMPIPVLVRRDADDIDAQRRQEAFHRLQWLKIEGGRLAEENKRLASRLTQLRKEQEMTQKKTELKSQIMEQKMLDLEMQEAEKQEQLTEIQGTLGKAIVRDEAYIRIEEEEKSKKPRTDRDHKKGKAHHKKKVEWSPKTAMELEAEATQSLIRAETAKIDAKRRERRQSRLAAQRDESCGSRCPASFSQPGASSIGAAYGAGYGGAQATSSGIPMSERTVQRTLTTVQEKRPPRSSSGGCPARRK